MSTIEYFFGWLIFRTKTYGKTKNGRKEWYVVDKISRLKKAKAKISGKDLGRYTKFSPKANFGFTARFLKIVITSLNIFLSQFRGELQAKEITDLKVVTLPRRSTQHLV